MAEKIKVYLKIRDDLQKEEDNERWEVDKNNLKQILSEKEEIVHNYFDRVFLQETNKNIFEESLVQSLHNLIEMKKSSTIFAYGQTGTGKTFLMMGNEGNEGIVKRFLKEIYERQKERGYKVKLSFLEIYNEKLIDLFNEKNEPKFYSNKGELQIENLENKVVNSLQESLDLIKTAEIKRRTEKTDFNLRSSRSHTIFVIELSKNNKKEILTLIDLAGSEKPSQISDRRKEGAFINKSLLALGNLITNMNETPHLNYRDSKLTRVLEPSMKREVDLIAFCLISPLKKFISESLRTLSFSSRLSEIKMNFKPSKIQKNEDINLCECEEEKEKLKTEILRKEIKMNEINEEINSLRNKYEDLLSNFINENEEKDLLKKRIQNLERMINKITETFPQSKLKDIFLIEKGLFNLKMEDLNKNIKNAKKIKHEKSYDF